VRTARTASRSSCICGSKKHFSIVGDVCIEVIAENDVVVEGCRRRGETGNQRESIAIAIFRRLPLSCGWDLR
jgi:hypothetical protein